jgi:metal-responsive CopG/Arc/MetJ family transcriptional regulator
MTGLCLTRELVERIDRALESHASGSGMSRSAFVRMLLTRALRDLESASSDPTVRARDMHLGG